MVGAGLISSDHPVRITIVYRYFWPDTAPYSRLLAKMVPWFVEAGYKVDIIAGQPSYGGKTGGAPRRETKFGASVKRYSLLNQRIPKIAAVNMLLFSLLAAFTILFGKKRDIVWFGTTPPVIQAFFVGIASRMRGAKTIYQMQDIHPAIAIKAGVMKPSLLTAILEKMNLFTLRRCSAVTVLSEDMAAYISDITGEKVNLKIINNFAVGEEAKDRRPPKNSPVRFCYAGNVGHFQNAKSLIHEFAKADPENIMLEVVGSGKAMDDLKRFCTANAVKSVRFFGEMSTEEITTHLEGCDYGVVSLLPGLHPFAFPSKIQTYLAAGLPLFALVDADSSIAGMIDREKLGYHAAWSVGSDAIREKIQDAASHIPPICNVPQHLWSAQTARGKWLSLIDELRAGA